MCTVRTCMHIYVYSNVCVCVCVSAHLQVPHPLLSPPSPHSCHASAGSADRPCVQCCWRELKVKDCLVHCGEELRGAGLKSLVSLRCLSRSVLGVSKSLAGCLVSSVHTYICMCVRTCLCCRPEDMDRSTYIAAMLYCMKCTPLGLGTSYV